MEAPQRICKKPLTKVDYLQAIEDAAVPIPLIEAGDDEGMPVPPANDGADYVEDGEEEVDEDANVNDNSSR